MWSTLHFTEPQPTSTTSHQHTGIGGAGNIRRALPPSSLTTPLTPKENPPSSPRFSTGRGGAGNIPSASDHRAMFSLDEEVERKLRPAPVTFHTGRGGEGNAVHERREGAESRSSSASGASATSGRSGRSGRQRAKGSLEVAREWLRRW